MIPWYAMIIYPAKWSKKVAHWKLQSITSLSFAMIIQAPTGKSPGLRAHSWTPPQTCWVASVGPEVKMLQKFFLWSLCKSLRITTWALQVSRNKNHFTSLSAVDVRVRSEQWAGKAQWLDAQTLEIKVVFTHHDQAARSSVPTRTSIHATAGPLPLLPLCLKSSSPSDRERLSHTSPEHAHHFLRMGHPVGFLLVSVYTLKESHSES